MINHILAVLFWIHQEPMLKIPYVFFGFLSSFCLTLFNYWVGVFICVCLIHFNVTILFGCEVLFILHDLNFIDFVWLLLKTWLNNLNVPFVMLPNYYSHPALRHIWFLHGPHRIRHEESQNWMQSLMSRRSLCQAMTRAVKVVQLGDIARTHISRHPRTDNTQKQRRPAGA